MRRIAILAALVAVCLAAFGSSAHARTLTIAQNITTKWFNGTVSGTFDTVTQTGSFEVKGTANPNKTRVAAYTIDATGNISRDTTTSLYTVNGGVTVIGPNGTQTEAASATGSTLLQALANFYKEVTTIVHELIGLG